MDLGVWWRDRRWRALLEVIDTLGTRSRLAEARLMDEDRARAILEAQDAADADPDLDPPPPASWAPSIRDVDASFEALVGIHNMIASFLSDGDADPFPRPVTAVDLVRRKRAAADAEDIIRIATPDAWRRLYGGRSPALTDQS